MEGDTRGSKHHNTAENVASTAISQKKNRQIPQYFDSDHSKFRANVVIKNLSVMNVYQAIFDLNNLSKEKKKHP